jgi:hypothetical protein
MIEVKDSVNQNTDCQILSICFTMYIVLTKEVDSLIKNNLYLCNNI